MCFHHAFYYLNIEYNQTYDFAFDGLICVWFDQQVYKCTSHESYFNILVNDLVFMKWKCMQIINNNIIKYLIGDNTIIVCLQFLLIMKLSWKCWYRFFQSTNILWVLRWLKMFVSTKDTIIMVHVFIEIRLLSITHPSTKTINCNLWKDLDIIFLYPKYASIFVPLVYKAVTLFYHVYLKPSLLLYVRDVIYERSFYGRPFSVLFLKLPCVYL